MLDDSSDEVPAAIVNQSTPPEVLALIADLSRQARALSAKLAEQRKEIERLLAIRAARGRKAR